MPTTCPAPIDDETTKNAGERLAAARAAKGFDSATEAAKAFGWNENTYRSAENGSRGIKAARAREYAKAFGVDPMWILFGDNDDEEDGGGGISIKAARKAKGLTQEKLAVSLGVSVQAVSQWEGGRTAPSTKTLFALSDILGVDPQELRLREAAEPDTEHARPNSIAHYRKLAGLSQRDLGDKVGIHWVTLSKVENGRTASLRWNQMVEIGKVLGVEPAALAEAR